MRSLWSVNCLSERNPDFEIGILTFEQIYNNKVIDTNKEFLHETDFVLFTEPSVMLGTSQVALKIIEGDLGSEKHKPVYCIFDRYMDGLVDTMSHLLHAEITDVVAMPVPRTNYTAISWDVDGDYRRQQFFDKQTRYLGNGVELAAVAVKNQIPEVTWYGERKAPVRDIKWIAGQYYSTICRYINKPVQQESIYDNIKFVSNLWSAPRTKEQFLIAEDEFCNMFSVIRSYLSRGENQVFVNVLSDNYLLRDYMRYNMRIFMTNPNAVPVLVPDYAKTERNLILKLVLLMSLRQVSEDEIKEEFDIIGLKSDDILNTLTELLRKYTSVTDQIINVEKEKKYIDEYNVVISDVYSITQKDFNDNFFDSLKNAYYIIEDEKTEQDYIDAKFFNHVTQTIMPGQFISYNGKYYQAKYVSPQTGVVLRRASDLYDGRQYYRQARNYHFINAQDENVVSSKKIMDMEFDVIHMDFIVETTGYLVMSNYNDLKTARFVDTRKDPITPAERKYHNKSVLRIKLDGADEKICFTLCLLLTEAFKTVFPGVWHYISAVTRHSTDEKSNLDYVVYPADGKTQESCIYIVEDSELDLGLLNAVENNFMQLMEVIADYLDWHIEKMEEAPEEKVEPKLPEPMEPEVTKKKGAFGRLIERIKNLFQRKKKKDDKGTEKPKTDKGKNPGEGIENSKGVDSDARLDSVTEQVTDKNQPMLHQKDDVIRAESDVAEGEGKGEGEGGFDIEYEDPKVAPSNETQYQKECYLKFGYEMMDDKIGVEELRAFLYERGWCDNSLTRARKGEVLDESELDTTAENRCDFCGRPLSGVSYDVLTDGRVRCNDCSASAITSVEEFKEIFNRCIEWMEDFYGVKFNVPVRIKVTDAKEIAKGVGQIFKPTSGYDARTIGYAQRKGKKYSILIENGSPRLCTIETLVHELTHIWQYLNWDDSLVASFCKMNKPACSEKARLVLFEGMAVWSATQCLYMIGETYFASVHEANEAARNDVYGIGFRLFCNRYPLIKDSSLLNITPFMSFPPVGKDELENAVRESCEEEVCGC